MVWDGAKGAAVPYAEAVATAALEGSFDVDGKKAITVLESLKRNQRPYTCEWAEGVCGASAETIAEVARKYATGGPAYLAFGQGGSDKYSNPDIIGHAGMVLGRDRDFWHTPPAAALFLHRKLGGLYLLAARLKARVDVASLAKAFVVTAP